jgi:hypothetical protein
MEGMGVDMTGTLHLLYCDDGQVDLFLLVGRLPLMPRRVGR